MEMQKKALRTFQVRLSDMQFVLEYKKANELINEGLRQHSIQTRD